MADIVLRRQIRLPASRSEGKAKAFPPSVAAGLAISTWLLAGCLMRTTQMSERERSPGFFVSAVQLTGIRVHRPYSGHLPLLWACTFHGLYKLPPPELAFVALAIDKKSAFWVCKNHPWPFHPASHAWHARGNFKVQIVVDQTCRTIKEDVCNRICCCLPTSTVAASESHYPRQG